MPKKKAVKGQGKKLPKTGFHTNPERINKEGGTDADATYAYLIKKAGEVQSKKDKTKTRKIVAIDKQWDKAEDGELSSFNALLDRAEGKPPQGIGSVDPQGNFKEQSVNVNWT